MEKIYALSFTRKRALEKLDGLSLAISEHICKICLMPTHESYNHWINELKNWRKQLTRFNSSKMGKPNYNTATLKHYLFSEPLGTLGDLILVTKMIEDSYAKKFEVSEKDHKDIESKMDRYLESILSNDDKWVEG